MNTLNKTMRPLGGGGQVVSPDRRNDDCWLRLWRRFDGRPR